MIYDITIAVHCWRYSRLLAYQLGSLIRWPPKCRVLIQVYCFPGDVETVAVIRWHQDLMSRVPNVQIYEYGLGERRLKNRSIGRNLAAQKCESRLLYFSDCDYVFGPGYLDAVSEKVTDEMVVAYPRIQYKCDRDAKPTECVVGDAYVARSEPGKLMKIDVKDFMPDRPHKAIGGIQIVPQWVAKKYGYLPDSRRHQGEKAHWVKTTSDVSWRKHVCRSEDVSQTGIGLDLPPVYRIRHSECGRDNHDLVM